MRIHCRHCRNPIEITGEQAEEILCSTCGTTFRLDETATPTFVEPHRRLGKFQLLGRVGVGGFGAVWRARDTELDRTVALKIMHTNLITSAGHRERFYREARAAAQLRHPGIVPVHDVLELEGSPAIVSEFIDGVTLAELIETRRPSFRESTEIIAQVAEALEYAHSLGIVHRDLKPGNIMLEFRRPRIPGEQTSSELSEIRPRPRLLDFGLALRAEVEQTMTVDGQVLGTPAYMSPTLASGRSHAADRRSDIYSLGVVLYELLCGELPFQGSKLMMLHQVLHEEPRRPRQINPKIPRDLETICLKAMAKSSAQRFHTARELADDLRRYLNGEPIHARPVGAVERLWRWCLRNPILASLTASVAALLAMLAIGATFAAVRLRAERNVALTNLDRAEKAEQEKTEKLWDSYLAQARAGRWSGRAGRRFDSLGALAKAAEIQPKLELRNEAIACMALVDVRATPAWDGYLPGTVLLNFDGNLEHYARGNEKGDITVHRVADLREVAKLPGFGKAVGWVLKSSDDGKFLAAKYQGGTFQLWNVESREVVLKLPGGVHRGAVEFSPDPGAPRLAIGQEDGSIALYDLTTVSRLRQLAPSGMPGAIALPNAIAYHPSQPRLAVSVWQDSVVQIRDLDSGNVLRTLPHPGQVYGIAWRRDGQLLATACADYRVYVWDIESPRANEPLAVLKGHQAEVVNVGFNHVGDLLVSSSWDGTSRLWDAHTGRYLVSFPAGRGIPKFNSDDSRLAYGVDDSKLWLWEVARGVECRTLHHAHDGQKGPWGVDFSPDGRLMATAGRDVLLWDLTVAQPIAQLPVGETSSALFHLDGLITTSRSGVHRWPIASEPNGRGHFLKIGPPQPLDPGPGRRRASQSANGRLLAVITGPEQVMVWDTDEPGKNVALGRHPRVDHVAISPDAKWVATGTWGGSLVKIWDAASGELVTDLSEKLSSAQVAFSPDGQWLVTGTGSEYRFWKVGSWTPAHRIRPDQVSDLPAPMAFSRDGNMLAILHSRYVVRLVDPATGEQLATLESPDPQHLSWLSFSPDGSLLAAASETNVVQLWDLRAVRRQLAAMKLDWDFPPPPPATRHDGHEPLRLTVVPGEWQHRAGDPERRWLVEAESLVAGARTTDGEVFPQSMTRFQGTWSGNAQLFWAPTELHARLTLTLPVPAAATYTVAGHFTKAYDYGQFQVWVNGQKVGEPFDGFHPHVMSGSLRYKLGDVALGAGDNEIVFEIVGKDGRSTGYMVGIDALEFVRADEGAAR